jgi:hypothetical protein
MAVRSFFPTSEVALLNPFTLAVAIDRGQNSRLYLPMRGDMQRRLAAILVADVVGCEYRESADNLAPQTTSKRLV